MKKNLSIFYAAPLIEECTYAFGAVLCASGDVTSDTESFIEGDVYEW